MNFAVKIITFNNILTKQWFFSLKINKGGGGKKVEIL